MFSFVQQLFKPRPKQPKLDNVTAVSSNPLRVQVWENKQQIKTVTVGKPLEVHTISQFK